MPWEDIITDLKRNIGDAALEDIPRSAATVKYMMRVHLKVGIIDFTKKVEGAKGSTVHCPSFAALADRSESSHFQGERHSHGPEGTHAGGGRAGVPRN